MERFATIAGTGSYVPEKVLTNADLSNMLGEDIDQFVSQVVGIKERHFCAEHENSADLAFEAGKRALAAAQINATDLDLIIVATDTPAYLSPATSVVVQKRLGATRAGTFDVNCACAGFVTALDVATKYIVADMAYKYILVIGTYAMSKFIDWNDKKTATIFADGSGAILLKASERPGNLAAKLYADGQYANYMGIMAGGSAMPITESVLKEGLYNKVRFLQRYPPEVNIEGWPAMIRDVLQQARLDIADIAHFFFTQVNLSTIKAVMDKLEMPMSKAPLIMDKWGYTGAACIPMALDDSVKKGLLQNGDRLLMCASGGGLNMACSIFEWQA